MKTNNINRHTKSYRLLLLVSSCVGVLLLFMVYTETFTTFSITNDFHSVIFSLLNSNPSQPSHQTTKKEDRQTKINIDLLGDLKDYMGTVFPFDLIDGTPVYNKDNLISKQIELLSVQQYSTSNSSNTIGSSKTLTVNKDNYYNHHVASNSDLNVMKIEPFDARQDLFVLVMVLPNNLFRLYNSYYLCNFLRLNYSINCELFFAFDGSNLSRTEICDMFANSPMHFIDKQFCYIDAQSVNRIANDISAILTYNYSLNHIFCENDDVNCKNKHNYKYVLMFESDALIYDNFIDTLSQRLNELIIWHNREYFKIYHRYNDSLFDVIQLKPSNWCINRYTHYQTKLSNISSNSWYKYDVNAHMFNLGTALLFSKNGIEKLLNNFVPYNHNSDQQIAHLMELGNINNNPWNSYAICPSIVGEIGGYSTTLQGKLHSLILPGFQTSEEEIKRMRKMKKQKRNERINAIKHIHD